MLTRVGEGCKLFILGDPGQCDIPQHKSGFVPVTDIFDDGEAASNGVYVFKFTEEDIMRSAFTRFV